jgi:hypothetical protein
MPRQTAQVEVNGFEGGLVTDQNPLELKPNTTSSEKNMDLNKDKSRSRRLGFDMEDNYFFVDSGVAYQSGIILGKSVYTWENAGGDVDKKLFIVQLGTNLRIFDLDNDPVSQQVIYNEDFVANYSQVFSYAVVDGVLVIVDGQANINYYVYDTAGAFVSKGTDRLKVRDLFGIEATVGGLSMSDAENFQYRPTSITDYSLYNYRNSTWHTPYRKGDATATSDTVRGFELSSGGKFPSFTDNMQGYIYANASNAVSRTAERYWPDDHAKAAAESSSAPTGFFVIDALARGQARLDAVQEHAVRNPTLTYTINSLPTDETPGGASVVAEYSGRVFYAGFSGDVFGGDAHSPRMSSFVLFSQTVKDFTEITQCYQKADPTSIVDPDLVATDGGFIRIDGAYDIKKMINIADKLLVFAKNGVWAISGPDLGGFRADDYLVTKISDHGTDSPGSVVLVDETAFYWGEESIYYLAPEKVSGAYQAKDITTTVIKSHYLAIPIHERKTASGYFDKYTRKIHWVYIDDVSVDTVSKELVFNVDFSAYTENTINAYTGSIPRILDLGPTQPYAGAVAIQDVTAAGVYVVAATVAVEATVLERTSQTSKELLYLVLTQVTGTMRYSFGAFDDPTLYDFDSLGGVDTPAWLTMNSVTGGAGRFKKSIPYLTTYFKQTETAVDGNFELVNPSSAMLTVRWDWTDHANANKWSNPRQAYRIRRPYFQTPTTFDDGNTILRTKNRIRGYGSSIAFKLESEAGKNLHIYGWGFDLDKETIE